MIKKIGRLVLEIVSIALGLLYIMPVLMVLLNMFKPLGKIIVNPFTLPESLFLDNISYVIQNMHYFTVLKNTLIIAVGVVLISVLVSSMAGWMLTRDNSRMSKIITVLLLSSMLVPFQTFMIPIAKLASALHINDTSMEDRKSTRLNSSTW